LRHVKLLKIRRELAALLVTDRGRRRGGDGILSHVG